MYWKQKESGTIPSIIHANGPAKFTDYWDKAVSLFFSEPKVKGEVDDDLTVMTWSIPSERTLLENCFEKYDIEDRLIVIPMSEPFDFLDKIRKMHKYLKGIKTKYCMALDATDVLTFGNDACNEALALFKKKDVKAIFGAEIPQWPNMETGQGITKPHSGAPLEMNSWINELKKVRRIDEVYAWLNSSFTHLNSGCWIGETRYMYDFYEELMQVIPEGRHPEELFGGDQGFIQLVAGRRYPEVILDYKSELFLNLSETTKEQAELIME